MNLVDNLKATIDGALHNPYKEFQSVNAISMGIIIAKTMGLKLRKPQINSLLCIFFRLWCVCKSDKFYNLNATFYIQFRYQTFDNE